VDGPRLVVAAGVTVGLAEQRPARGVEHDAEAHRHHDEDEQQEECDSAFHFAPGLPHTARATNGRQLAVRSVIARATSSGLSAIGT
jgi:hypothetical protein